MFDGLIDVLMEWVYKLLYLLFSGICFLIDFLKDTFYKLCGLDKVSIDGKDTDLLTNLIESDIIRKVFLTIFIIGFILIIIFTIIGIIKSNYQEKITPKQVLVKASHSFIIALLIPFTIYAGITLINTIMGSINMAMNAYGGNATTTIGGQFLATIGYDAYIGDEAQRELIIGKFVSGEVSYTDLTLVGLFFNLGDMHFLLGILGSLVMLVMFVLSALTFVQRIFDVVLLYIISPICISTIPLDEGNRFKVWKDMMIAKLLSAFGIILVLNLYFLIMPQVSKIKFFDNGFSNGVVYILFLIGGSFALTKASRVISQLCGAQAAGGELAQMIYNIRSGMAFAHMSKALVAGGMATVLLGSDYKKSRKAGNGKIDAMKDSFKSKRGEYIPKTDNPSKFKKYGGMPIRLATMPVGMVRDFARGGIVRVGKNFIPRCRNVIKGDTLTNRAQVSKKAMENLKTKGSKTAYTHRRNNRNNDDDPPQNEDDNIQAETKTDDTDSTVRDEVKDGTPVDDTTTDSKDVDTTTPADETHTDDTIDAEFEDIDISDEEDKRKFIDDDGGDIDEDNS